MLDPLDNFLNRYTMYRVLVYGLSIFLVIAAVLGLTNAVSLSATHLAISVAILCAACYLVNKLFSIVLRVPANTESWLITALILACILPPADSLQRGLYVALAAVLAMASKYIVKFRGINIFNPAAFAAFVLSITALLPATWWVATPWLTPFTALLGFIVLRKQRKFKLFFAFALSAVAMLVVVSSVLQGSGVADVLRGAVESWPIIFFGSIMLTEPTTLPPTLYYQVLLAVIEGVLFTSQLHAGRLSSEPQTVLLFGNLLTVLALPAFGAILKPKQLKALSPDIYEATFARPARLKFTAGQYIQLTLPHQHADSRGNRRTFSIASSPAEADMRIAFRHYPKSSSFKNEFVKLSPATTVRGSHVAGNFTLPSDPAKPLIFIAGGIGITPFHSMIGSLAGQQRDIVMLYLANTPQDFVYRTDFENVVGLQSHFLQGRLEADALKQLVPDLSKRLVYISGPDPMVRAYKKLLVSQGASGASIKTDHFTGY